MTVLREKLKKGSIDIAANRRGISRARKKYNF